MAKPGALILAAGDGERMLPLSASRPKSHIMVANRTLLRHNLDQLSGLVGKVVIVYSDERVKGLGDRYRGMRLEYRLQERPLGTGHAVSRAAGALDGRFVVLMGDDLYTGDDISRCLKTRGSCVLSMRVDDPRRFGVLTVKEGLVTRVTEKPSRPASDRVYVGLSVVDESMFDLFPRTKKSRRGEHEYTDMLNALFQKDDVRMVEASGWWPVGHPWDILDANAAMLDILAVKGSLPGAGKAGPKKVTAAAFKGVHVRGVAFAGPGTRILPGTYIEGPVLFGRDCVIGPNSYIRPYTTLGDGCKVGASVELKNTVVFDSARIPHLSYVGDSVVGEGVNLGAGTVCANLRHDKGHVLTPVRGKMTDTGRKKLGAVIGDGVSTGINTTIYPGRKLWPGVTTAPGQVVKEDIRAPARPRARKK